MLGINETCTGDAVTCEQMINNISVSYNDRVLKLNYYGFYGKSTATRCSMWSMAFVSFFCYALIAITIMRHKQLKAHPMKIFMLMAILECYLFCEILFCWNPIQTPFFLDLFSGTLFFTV